MPMLPDAVTRWASRLGCIGEGALHTSRLDIVPRLLLCFACIVLTMLCGGAVVLSEFRVVRVQAERLDDLDQQLVAVLRLHASLLSFHGRLEELAEAEDAGRLAAEAEALRRGVLEETERARIALQQLPAAVTRDRTILPTLEAVQGALPSQLQTLSHLAVLGDWRAVRSRLANQRRPLETMASALVEKVYAEAARDQADAVENIDRVQRRVSFMVPATAIATVLIALTLGLLITRSITQPLTRLVEGAEALAHGEFGHQVPIRGRDELAHLGQVFNATTRRLRDLYTELQQREAKIRRLFEANIIGIFIYHLDGRIIDANDAFLRIVEYDRDDLVAGRLRWTDLTPPEWLERDQRVHVPQLKMVGAVQPFEKEYFRRDGSRVPVLVGGAHFEDNVGEGVAFVLDLTVRRRAEDARTRAEAELQQARSALAHRQRVSLLGEVAASLAHEIRQPIAAAQVDAKVCLRALADDRLDVELAREAAARLLKDAMRADEIIKRTTALYKKDTTHRERVDINAVIRETTLLLQHEARASSVAIRTELAEEIPEVMADRVQLQQILMNLMLNAIEAMKGTGGDLAIRSEMREPGELLISVSDHGVGLPMDIPGTMFDAFVTTKPQGTGMGLAITRSIVDAHGGRLWASANAGPGATFFFTLSADAAKHPPSRSL
jgi:PAS domain S-box-containing protein